MKNNKNFIIASLILVIIVGGYLVYSRQSAEENNNSDASNQDTVVLSAQDEANLKTAVYEKIDNATQGVWDKDENVNISNAVIHPSKMAVSGSWSAKDWWEWFAWQSTDGNWNIMVSLDGWDCEELDALPQEYTQFFNDNTYQLSAESIASLGRYCYDHSSRK